MTEKLPPTLAAEPTSDSSARADQASHATRYEDLGRIAEGGSGEVRRVRDVVLDRVLAMKVLRWEYVDSARMRARFLAEAQVTAGLQHPGIVAVHDRGERPDGRLWFTMKEVRGRTLDKVIAEVHAASGPEGFRAAPSGWTFRRLVDALARVGQAVGYAHSRCIIHRDLKPENVMVGEFGEVLVMDWGLARHTGEAADPRETPHDPREEPDPVVAPDDARPSDGPAGNPTVEIEGDGGAESQREPRAAVEILWTRHGDILGTPAYMPLEQAHGQRDLHGPASDVYALGAILYHLLTGRPPYDGDNFAVWRQVIAGPPPPIEEAARGGPPVPAELAAIAARAMQRAIPDRYPDAATLTAELVTWLDGARRREQALAALEDAGALAPAIADLRGHAALAQAEARALLNAVRPSDPVEKKRPAWELEREAARLSRQAAILEAEWLQRVHGALSQDPDLPEAHAALADHYRERITAAEIAHQDEDAARFEVLLQAHDRGRHAAFLRGNATLTVVTDPPGAEVTLHRYALIDHRLAPEHVADLGPTPLLEVPLTRGSYLLLLRAPGRAEVRYPVLLERDGKWDGRPPGEAAPRAIVLPPEGELGADDVYVPAGFAWTGGDLNALDSLPRRLVWIEGFVIRRFPVTNREYLAFLNDLAAAGREADALASTPVSLAGPRPDEPLVERDASGLFVLRAGGPATEPDLPVVSVSWHAASAYAAWLAERTGKPWRLLNDVEREKAARGADGRIFPWGDHAEATYPCAAESHAGEPHRAPVDGHPFDESPYGVRGLAGNARDWCVNPWRRDGPPIVDGRLAVDPAAADDESHRSVRGGAWGSPISYSRAAGRFGSPPAHRFLTMGFRLARSYP